MSSYVFSPSIFQLIDLALEEDIGQGDVTSDAIFSDMHSASAVVCAKEELILSGTDVFGAVMTRLDNSVVVHHKKKDGEKVSKGDAVLEVFGKAKSVLMAERTALNFLQRLSGIATKVSQMAQLLAGTSAVLVDTRKTLPGFRFLDKRAVQHGGGQNHRASLSSGILIKDNHIAAFGGVKASVMRLKEMAPLGMTVEVEVTTIKELEEALQAKADVVLLDNMDLKMVANALQFIKTHSPSFRPLIEVSGGMNEKNIRDYALLGVDRISVGALTHSVKAVDLSLEFSIDKGAHEFKRN